MLARGEAKANKSLRSTSLLTPWQPAWPPSFKEAEVYKARALTALCCLWGKHLLSLPTPSPEWQCYLSPLGRGIATTNVILIRCSSCQPSYEDGFTEVRGRWENLIKVSHQENTISVDVQPEEDVTSSNLLTRCIDNYALNGSFSLDSSVCSRYIRETIHLMSNLNTWARKHAQTYSGTTLSCLSPTVPNC